MNENDFLFQIELFSCFPATFLVDLTILLFSKCRLLFMVINVLLDNNVLRSVDRIWFLFFTPTTLIKWAFKIVPGF